MYDHMSRFNPAPSSPLSPAPTASEHDQDRDHGQEHSNISHQTSSPTNTRTHTRRLSTRTLFNIQRHTNAHFARQGHERTTTWLSEAQMLRQFKRVIWKVQTKEEWLVMDLDVVRSAVAEMMRTVEGRRGDVGMMEGRQCESDSAERTEKWRAKGRGWMGRLECGGGEEVEVEEEGWELTDWQMRDDVKEILARLRMFMDHEFAVACEEVLRCREYVDGDEAYEVLDEIISIRATADDRRWFEDLPSLGEQAGFGGLEILNARKKVVVWAIAEVYQKFKAEEGTRRHRGGSDGEAGSIEWTTALIETGEWLEECDLISTREAWRNLGIDPGVISLCESLEHMSLDEHEEGPVRKKVKRGNLKSQVERLWQKAFGYLRKEFCASC